MLTVAQIVLMRRWVGRRPSDDDLQTIYDRTGSLTETVREVLETRRADLIADPASYAITGEYSQDTRANIDAINKLLAQLGDLDSEDTGDDGQFVRIIPPARTRIR